MQRRIALLACTFTLVGGVTLAVASPLPSAGAYRIDLNGKVRDLCVDEIGLGELSAKGWQSRLADQGVRCTLHDQKRGRQSASWTGRCSAPGMGKVFNTEHRVSVQINADGSFELLTLLSGDLQARIPVRGEPKAVSPAGQKPRPADCDSQLDTFRPWQ